MKKNKGDFRPRANLVNSGLNQNRRDSREYKENRKLTEIKTKIVLKETMKNFKRLLKGWVSELAEPL
jgi:hypothetical protein